MIFYYVILQNKVKMNTSNSSRSKFWVDTGFEINGKAKNRDSIDGISYRSLEISNPVELTSSTISPEEITKRSSLSKNAISAPLERSPSVEPPEVFHEHDNSKMTLVSGYSLGE